MLFSNEYKWVSQNSVYIFNFLILLASIFILAKLKKFVHFILFDFSLVFKLLFLACRQQQQPLAISSPFSLYYLIFVNLSRTINKRFIGWKSIWLSWVFPRFCLFRLYYLCFDGCIPYTSRVPCTKKDSFAHCIEMSIYQAAIHVQSLFFFFSFYLSFSSHVSLSLHRTVAPIPNCLIHSLILSN